MESKPNLKTDELPSDEKENTTTKASSAVGLLKNYSQNEFFKEAKRNDAKNKLALFVKKHFKGICLEIFQTESFSTLFIKHLIDRLQDHEELLNLFLGTVKQIDETDKIFQNSSKEKIFKEILEKISPEAIKQQFELHLLKSRTNNISLFFSPTEFSQTPNNNIGSLIITARKQLRPYLLSSTKV